MEKKPKAKIQRNEKIWCVSTFSSSYGVLGVYRELQEIKMPSSHEFPVGKGDPLRQLKQR